MGNEVRSDCSAPLSPLISLDDDIAGIIFAYVRSAGFTSEDMMRILCDNVASMVEQSVYRGGPAGLRPIVTYLAVKSNACLRILKIVIGASQGSLTWKGNQGNMPLHCALQKNMRGNSEDDLEVVRILMGDTTTAVLHENHLQMTPLRIALRSGCAFDIINLLMSFHVDVVNLPRLGGFTELHKALIYPFIGESLMQLMISKATPKTLLCVQDVSSTPLTIAVVFLETNLRLYGTAVIKSLVQACPEAIGTFDRGKFYTPLHHLLMSSNLFDHVPTRDDLQGLDIVEFFITSYPQVLRIRDITGRIPADICRNMPRARTGDATVLLLQKLFVDVQPTEDTLNLATCSICTTD